MLTMAIVIHIKIVENTVNALNGCHSSLNSFQLHNSNPSDACLEPVRIEAVMVTWLLPPLFIMGGNRFSDDFVSMVVSGLSET
jgi:hypothetical protein